MTGVVRPDSIPTKASCVKSEESGSMPSSRSHSSCGATNRIRPKVRTSEKRRPLPSAKWSTRCVAGDSGNRSFATTSRPVIRRLVTSDRPEASSATTYFPRRRTATMRSPATARAKRTPRGAMAIRGNLTSTRSIVLPTILPARPRTIVSTSGSSGTLILGTVRRAGRA